MSRVGSLVESLCHGLRTSFNLAADSARAGDRILIATLIRGIIPATFFTVLAAGTALADTAPICVFKQQISSGGIARSGAYALFTGARGTGMTFTAEVLAKSLDLDLYRVDLSKVVSKYIGETEKNLDRVFISAGGQDVVLLLDEGDALLGKRTETKDSHDRYANAEVNYLLQRIERFEGIVILATNLRAAAIPRTRKPPVIINFSPDRPNPRDQLKACK